MANLSYSEISSSATELAEWLIDNGHLEDISTGITAYESKHGTQDSRMIAQARSFADTYAGELEVSNQYSTYTPARTHKTTQPMLFKKERAQAAIINRAIREGYAFFVCRTINKKVERLPLVMLSVNLQTGFYEIVYRKEDELATENASPVDMAIIQQTAHGFAEKMQKAAR